MIRGQTGYKFEKNGSSLFQVGFYRVDFSHTKQRGVKKMVGKLEKKTVNVISFKH
jgi:hypothetical protein